MCWAHRLRLSSVVWLHVARSPKKLGWITRQRRVKPRCYVTTQRAIAVPYCTGCSFLGELRLLSGRRFALFDCSLPAPRACRCAPPRRTTSTSRRTRGRRDGSIVDMYIRLRRRATRGRGVSVSCGLWWCRSRPLATLRLSTRES